MILLAESGSTKTDWRIIGKEIHAFETIGLNPYFVSSTEVQKELEPHLNEITKNEIKEVHFYGTGITDSSKGDVIASGISSLLSENVKIYTYSDVVAAAKSLFGNSEGIACILGTGSNTCFWDGEKVSFQIPPLGFWLGDEGSGGYLGKALILAYLHKEMPLEIRNKFEEQYGAKDRLEILKHAYQLEKPNKYFAQYTPFILENLSHEFCYTLTTLAFKAFLEKYLLKYPQLKEVPIGAVGSIAHYFEKPLSETFKLYNISLSKVIKKPIDALIDFHNNKR